MLNYEYLAAKVRRGKLSAGISIKVTRGNRPRAQILVTIRGQLCTPYFTQVVRQTIISHDKRFLYVRGTHRIRPAPAIEDVRSPIARNVIDLVLNTSSTLVPLSMAEFVSRWKAIRCGLFEDKQCVSVSQIHFR